MVGSHMPHQANRLLSRKQYAVAEPHSQLSRHTPTAELDKQLQLQADAAVPGRCSRGTQQGAALQQQQPGAPLSCPVHSVLCGCFSQENLFHAWYAPSDAAAPRRQAGQGAAA